MKREAHARGDQFRRYTYGDVLETRERCSPSCARCSLQRAHSKPCSSLQRSSLNAVLPYGRRAITRQGGAPSAGSHRLSSRPMVVARPPPATCSIPARTSDRSPGAACLR